MKILKLKLHWQILIALFLAVLFGYYVPQGIHYTSWMGDIFLTALKMVIVPLILSSIISGVTSMGSGKNLGRLGGKTLLYYISTSAFAIFTGLILVNVLRPGIGMEMGFKQTVEGLTDKTSSVNDILMRIVPSNIFESMVNGDILPIIFFAVIFGVFIGRVGDKYRESLTTFFEAVFEVMMKMTMSTGCFWNCIARSKPKCRQPGKYCWRNGHLHAYCNSRFGNSCFLYFTNDYAFCGKSKAI